MQISATTDATAKGPAVTCSLLAAWILFFSFGAWIYHVLAEQEITAILTLSAFAQTLAFGLLQMQVSARGDGEGISEKALLMHAAKLCCRLSTTLWLPGYLPTDASGDWLYQNLMLGALVLAVLIHPSLNSWAPFDILWTTHLYIDAVAMMPQIWMISNTGGQVKGFTAHYIGATMLSHILSALFWFLASPELVEEDTDDINIAGLAINGAHVVQLLLLLDFGYFYGKALLRGNWCAGTMQIGFDGIDV